MFYRSLILVRACRVQSRRRADTATRNPCFPTRAAWTCAPKSGDWSETALLALLDNECSLEAEEESLANIRLNNSSASSSAVGRDDAYPGNQMTSRCSQFVEQVSYTLEATCFGGGGELVVVQGLLIIES